MGLSLVIEGFFRIFLVMPCWTNSLLVKVYHTISRPYPDLAQRGYAHHFLFSLFFFLFSGFAARYP